MNKKSLTFHGKKSVIFTKVELSTRQKRAKIVYQLDTGNKGNLMPFQIFKMLFLRSTVVDINAMVNR